MTDGRDEQSYIRRVIDWVEDPANPLFRADPDEWDLTHWQRPSTWRTVAFLSVTFTLILVVLYKLMKAALHLLW